jgi:hypothetical protein
MDDFPARGTPFRTTIRPGAVGKPLLKTSSFRRNGDDVSAFREPCQEAEDVVEWDEEAAMPSLHVSAAVAMFCL